MLLDLTFGDVASITTAVGVGVAAAALWRTEAQARTQFEDGLNHQYRDIANELPLHALFGKELSDQDLNASLRAFYRYVDLSNEQTYLRMKGRVRRSTWREWRDGIASNFNRPAFEAAWNCIRKETGERDFDELARLIGEDFRSDPRRWR